MQDLRPSFEASNEATMLLIGIPTSSSINSRDQRASVPCLWNFDAFPREVIFVLSIPTNSIVPSLGSSEATMATRATCRNTDAPRICPVTEAQTNQLDNNTRLSRLAI